MMCLDPDRGLLTASHREEGWAAATNSGPAPLPQPSSKTTTPLLLCIALCIIFCGNHIELCLSFSLSLPPLYLCYSSVILTIFLSSHTILTDLSEFSRDLLCHFINLQSHWQTQAEQSLLFFPLSCVWKVEVEVSVVSSSSTSIALMSTDECAGCELQFNILQTHKYCNQIYMCVYICVFL